MLPVKHPETLKWFWKRPLKWTIDAWKPPIFKLGASSCTEDNAEPPDAVPLGLPVATHELGKPTFWPTEYQHIINYSEWFYELQRCVDNGCFPLWIYIYYNNIYIYYIILKNIDNLGAFGASTQSISYDGCQRESHRQKRGYESKHDIWTGKKFAKIHCLGCSSVHSCLLVQWCQSSQPVVAI